MGSFFGHRPLFAAGAASVIALYGLTVWVPPFIQPAQPAALPAAAVLPSVEQVPASVVPQEPPLFEYIEVTDSCGPYFEGACLNLRQGPGMEYPAVQYLRTGMVLKTQGTIESGGLEWHRVVFDEWLRYPERAEGELYVAAGYAAAFLDAGPQELPAGAGVASTKRILIDRSSQMIYAYEGEVLFMKEKISTGLEFTPTPRGTFTIFRKTPSRYMQGPLPDISDQYYDLPGVPWNLYFTEQGGAIHGAYWHDHFGEPWSHGCVNLPLQAAKELYQWAELGTQVLVRD